MPGKRWVILPLHKKCCKSLFHKQDGSVIQLNLKINLRWRNFQSGLTFVSEYTILDRKPIRILRTTRLLIASEDASVALHLEKKMDLTELYSQALPLYPSSWLGMYTLVRDRIQLVSKTTWSNDSNIYLHAWSGLDESCQKPWRRRPDK